MALDAPTRTAAHVERAHLQLGQGDHERRPRFRRRRRPHLKIRHIFGCRAAAFLQKLPWRPRATSTERLGLLSCCWLVSRTFEKTGSRGAGEGEKRISRSEDRTRNVCPWSERGEARRCLKRRGDRVHPPTKLPGSPAPCFLDRTSRPKAATEASAIRAAVWQPKKCRIVGPRDVLNRCRGYAEPRGGRGGHVVFDG